jgi:hypothetical protein
MNDRLLVFIIIALAFSLGAIFIGALFEIRKLLAENLDLKRKRKAFVPKARLLNSSEQHLFHLLQEFFTSTKYYVLAQVHLASIVQVSDNAEDYYETLTDLDKSIDFVIMDIGTAKPALLIEYNGPEHHKFVRKVRDNFLDNVLKDCDIHFLTLIPPQILDKDKLKELIIDNISTK